MTKKLILAAFVAAMAMTACHKDPTPTPEPEPTPEPQTVTRLAYEHQTKISTLSMETHRHFTWENGDVTKLVEEILEPEDMAATHEVVYTYDDKANAYTGIPLAFAMPDGSGAQVAC